MEEDVSQLLFSIMEGYSDSVIPPLSQFSPLPEKTTGKDKVPASSSRNSARGKALKSAEKDVTMERHRREKMSEFYATLQSIVPNLVPKAPRAIIVDDTITYIKDLEETIKGLETRKKAAEANRSISLHTHRNSSVDVTVSGNTAFFGIRSVSRPGTINRIFHVFEKHKAEILAAGIVCDDDRIMTLTVTALVKGNMEGADTVELLIQRIKADLIIILS